MIPYGRQDITPDDIDEVVKVLKSDFITQGPVIQDFEKSVTAKVHSKYGVAVNSGTSALHLACKALHLSHGDSLWTVPNTFVASANCARYCGAEVDFVDIDPCTLNMDVSSLENKLVQAKKDNKLPKVVVPVDFAGQPVCHEEIHELSEKYGFYVLEDACHASGAIHNGEPVGSCKWSDITVFSFHPVKIITTGEGGMALTNNDEFAKRLALFRSHGITRDLEIMNDKSQGAWYYEMQELGYNYRMTEISAALGRSQLKRIDEYVARRNYLAGVYNEAFADLPLKSQTVLPGNLSSYHLYVVRVSETKRTNFYNTLKSAGIGVNVHYIPVHLQPYYRSLGFSPGYCPEAEKYSREAVTLPLFPTMTDEEQLTVINEVKKALL